MSNNRYTDEFKTEAVKQIAERGYSVADVAAQLGVSIHSLYAWQRKLEKPTAARQADTDQAAWLALRLSERGKDDLRVLGVIKHCWLESGGVYGYRKITRDLKDLGEACGKHRTARLMRREGLRAQVGYGRRPGSRGGAIHRCRQPLG